MKRIRMKRGYIKPLTVTFRQCRGTRSGMKERYAIGTTSLKNEQFKCLLLEVDGSEFGNSFD